MAIGNRYDSLRDHFGGDWKQYAEVDMAEATKSHPELALWDTANGKLLRILSEEVKHYEEVDDRVNARKALVAFMKACKATAHERAALVKTEVERQKILGEVFTMLQMARIMNELMGIIKRHVPDAEVRDAIGQEVQRLALGSGNGSDGPGISGL